MLTTPDKIRTLQRNLYCKANQEPTFRLYTLVCAQLTPSSQHKKTMP